MNETATPIFEQITPISDSELLNIIFCLPANATLIESQYSILEL